MLGVLCAVLLVLAWEVMPLPAGMGGATGTPRPAARIDAVGRLLLPLNYDLMLVSLPSREVRKLASAGERGVISSARWSRDGQSVAYVHFRPRGKEPIGSDVVTLRVGTDATDAPTPTTVVERDRAGAVFESPVWTPDQRALYVSYSGIENNQAVERIERLDVQSGARIPVVDGRLPELSPDGTRLAFIRTAQAGDALWIAAADGSNPRQLLAPDTISVLGSVRFAPDGRTIAVAVSRPPDQAVAPTPRRPFAILGTGVALAHGNPWEVYLLDAAGGSPRRLTQLQEDEIGISWSPSGAQLAVFGLRGVHLVDREGRATFAMNQGGFGGIDWGP